MIFTNSNIDFKRKDRGKHEQDCEKYIQHHIPYLLDLDYDTEDVVGRLKELTIAEYSETKIDKDDLNPPLLFVFGKDINSKFICKVKD